MRRMQSGATLIIVLILLLVMTVVGTMAIRGSLTALNIATNSQAQQLLLQNSDAAIFNVENPALVERNNAYDGLFGLVKADANKGKELVFCYRGAATSFYNISRASFMQWVSGTSPNNAELGLDGYCKLDNSINFFTSGRKAVMTQVAVKYSSEAEKDAFYGQILGTDDNTVKLQRSKPVKVFAVSIMPALTTADKTKIDECLDSHMNEVVIPSGVAPSTGADKSVTQCLSELNVPFESSVTEYVIAQDFV